MSKKIKGEQCMSEYSKKDIIRMVDEEDVEFIRLQFTDIFGTLKNVAITASQLEKALNNQCMFDGSSIEGFVRIEESDMYLFPDLDTFTVFPWRPQQGKVARIICDVYRPDKTPFEGDPRYILRKQIEEAYKSPIIYHCMGAMTGRPWEKGSIHPQNDIYNRYLKQSPWKDDEKKVVHRGMIFKIQRILYLFLPRCIYNPIHRFILKRYLTNMNRQLLNRMNE